MKLGELGIYRLAREISRDAWAMYLRFDWQTRKVIGDQWIEAIDSIGSNVAEGFGRFHYLDKNKFNYNARGSLMESLHWTDVLREREIIQADEAMKLIAKLNTLSFQLNNYIKSTRNQLTNK